MQREGGPQVLCSVADCGLQFDCAFAFKCFFDCKCAGVSGVPIGPVLVDDREMGFAVRMHLYRFEL